MRNYTFDFEIETMITQFIAAMDDIVIKRFDKDKNPQDSIKVRFVYSPKQRVLLDLLDKAQNIQLPVVAVSVGGISRDINRVFNKLQGGHIPSDEFPNRAQRLYQPVPIDLLLNLSILTRYQKDMDQIITNFIPYFDPYIIISWRTPSMPDQEIRSMVNWSGNINLTYPQDINGSTVARVAAETQFTVKGWLFKAQAGKSDALIFKVNTRFSSIADFSLESRDDRTKTDYIVLSAQPQPQIITE
jgi:hypothetical protein